MPVKMKPDTTSLVREYIAKYPDLPPHALRDKILEEQGIEVDRRRIGKFRRRLGLSSFDTMGRPLEKNKVELPEPKITDYFREAADIEAETPITAGRCLPNPYFLNTLEAIGLLRKVCSLLGDKEQVKQLLEVL